MIVVDASIVVLALGEDSAEGARVRWRLLRERLAAPEIVDLEASAAWRRLVRAGLLPARRAAQAVADLALLPMQRAPHRPLLARCWQLRENLTIYDAAYVALAEALGTPLLTADARLAGATGLRCTVELLDRRD